MKLRLNHVQNLAKRDFSHAKHHSKFTWDKIRQMFLQFFYNYYFYNIHSKILLQDNPDSQNSSKRGRIVKEFQACVDGGRIVCSRGWGRVIFEGGKKERIFGTFLVKTKRRGMEGIFFSAKGG
jgi:hypothetical protein